VLIKAADDKSKRLALLEDLQRSPLLDRRQKDWLRDELHRTRRGIAGERDAAHYLDNYLKDDPDRAVLHDLRFKVDGDVIQIDHLIITRSLYVYLLETKNFNGNVRINEHGEFSVQYGGEREFGIPSPLEQSRRHEGPLRKLFETLEIKGRNGRAPLIQHCMLVTPASMIHRPAAGTFDTTNVIKADQFRGWHEKFQDRTGIGETFGSLFNLRSADTIRAFAEKLVRQHRPADLLALPDFMKPREREAARAPVVMKPAPVREVAMATAPAAADTVVAKAPADAPKAGPRKLICATCGQKITFPEGKYCWNNEQRFGGLQYCREHQAAFA